jgi:Carboxypeptidase regulatory-like domain
MGKQLATMWLCCTFLIFGGAAAVSQTITGSIRGTVTDPSGAVVVAAHVTATNVETGVATSTVADGSGLYTFQFLTIGNYTITASAGGFHTESIGPFRLQIDQIAKVDVKLQIGSATTTVNIASTGSPLLNSENATLGTSISSYTLESMPLNSLNVVISTLYTPGAVSPATASMGGLMGGYRDVNTSNDIAASGVPSFNGNRQQGNNFILDGVEINETITNTLGYNPSPYSLQELRVISGNADAEYGNVNGGEVLMVSKSGTNLFHGNAFEYYRDQNLAANSWSNNNVPAGSTPIAKSPFTQNQFGGAVGGPVLKDKLFFFADYEGYRLNLPGGQAAASVPTALERTGDFSEELATYGPNFQLYNTANGNGAAAVPYLNNQGIPINNPVARYLFAHPSALPAPNHAPLATTVSQNNYVGNVSSKFINNQVDGRVDYSLTSKDTLMVKGTWGDAHDTQQSSPLAIVFPLRDDYPFYMGVIDWVRTFSPSLVNEARVGYSRIGQSNVVTDPTGLFGTKGNALVGIPLPAPQSVDGFTNISIGSSDNGGYGTTSAAGSIVVDNNFIYGDNLTWVHGKHVTKFGAQFVRYQENYFNAGNIGGVLGTFSYSGSYTAGGSDASLGSSAGDGYADFELDKAANAQVGGQSGAFGARQWRDAYYVQDDWKVLPGLTLNLGLRYGYDQPLYEANNKMVSVNLPAAYFAPAGTDPSTLLRFAGQNGNSRALINPYYKQFMPRVGFALQLNPRTVVRGGYGITDAMEGTGNGLRMTQNAPFTSSFTNNATAPADASGGTWLPAENGFTLSTPGALGSQYDVWDPHFQPSSVQQFNLTTEYQVRSKTAIQIGYVGQLGRHLATPVLLNQYTAPVPTTCAPADTTGCVDVVAPYYALVGGQSQIVETASRSVSSYNALQTTLRQQESNGLEFTFNYTYSKSLTNNPGGYFGVGDTLGGLSQFWQNAYDPQADYGKSAFDVPSNFNGTIVYQLPFGHNKRFGSSWGRLTDEALGGWEASGNVILSSGFPITLYENPGNDNLNSANSYNYNGLGRVNQYLQPKLVHRTRLTWFGTDPSATPCTTPGNTINALGVPCAYGVPAFNQFGTASNNTERGPGSKNFDMSLFKAFRTFREQNVKFRVDAFNAFNMVNLGLPSARVTKATFGEINGTSGTYAPRQFQFSVVYQF